MRTPLPVVQHLVGTHPISTAITSRTHLLIIQHIMEDTEFFVKTVSRLGFRSVTVIGIPYSSKPENVHRLRSSGVLVLDPPNDDISHTIVSEMGRLLDTCASSGEKLVIHEVGGRCTNAILHWREQVANHCLGVVEDTTYGRRMYEAVAADLPVPVYHVADSELKDLEAIYVGEAVAEAVQSAFKCLGRRIAGLKTSVLGFGPIGESVARSMHRRMSIVSVYDIDPVKMVRASSSGFNVDTKRMVLANSDLVIGASGNKSVLGSDLDTLRPGAVLCSASSRRVELAVEELQARAVSDRALSDNIHAYRMPDGKELALLEGGYPVNFRGGSVPDEVIDLVYAEIYLCLRLLLAGRTRPGLFPVTAEVESLVAKTWFELRYSGGDCFR